MLAGDAFGRRGLFVGSAELPFQHAINAADFLLFAKLQAIPYNFLLAVFAMLSGDEVALFNGALLGVAAFALEIKLHALAPALPANWADISCPFPLLTFPYFRCGLQPTGGLRPAYELKPSTQRR